MSPLFTNLAFRGNVGDSLNGSSSTSIYASLAEEFTDADPPQRSKNNCKSAQHTQCLLCANT